MWRKIVSLFSDQKEKEKGHDATTQRRGGKWKDQVLTPESPRLDFAGKVELWAHQKAMLARCKWIEDHPTTAETRVMHQERYKREKHAAVPKEAAQRNAVRIGLMNDPPGCGKTFVMLALVAMDGAGKQTVVIVPMNILAQWEAALATLYGPAGGEWVAPSYASITELYHKHQALERHRVLLLLDTLTDVFALAQARPVHRVVIDEVDNIARRMTQPVACAHVWFVSASFDPDDKRTVAALPYEFDFERSIADVICSTDPAFVAESVKLPPPVLSTVICDDADVRLFEGLVDDRVLKSLHAGATRLLLNEIELRGPASLRIDKIASKFVDFHRERAARLAATMADLAAKGLTNRQLADEYDSLRRAHEVLAQRMSGNLETYVAPAPGADKWSRFEDAIARRMLDAPESKWLVFNDDLTGLLTAEGLLHLHGVACELLDGGSAEAVDRTLSRFKSGGVQALLINSKSEGCGLNLANATHVVFMHSTDTALVEQIVGRAQRFGRTSPLEIVGLLNASEANLYE